MIGILPCLTVRASDTTSHCSFFSQAIASQPFKRTSAQPIDAKDFAGFADIVEAAL
jgi:hypothetical protein